LEVTGHIEEFLDVADDRLLQVRFGHDPRIAVLIDTAAVWRDECDRFALLVPDYHCCHLLILKFDCLNWRQCGVTQTTTRLRSQMLSKILLVFLSLPGKKIVLLCEAGRSKSTKNLSTNDPIVS
jgi:hypothetical protein